MVDFSALTRRSSGQAVKPKALPPGDYQGIIRSHELGDNNKNRTPYVRFSLVLQGWPEGMDEAEMMQETPEGPKPIDLAKRQLRRDFFITDDALWRLDELLSSCGLELGPAYEELFPQLHNKPVLIEVQQYMNQQTGEIGNQVGKVVGLG